MKTIRKVYILRLYFVIFLGILLWLVLVEKLFSIQVLLGDKYAQRAEKQQKERFTLKAARGKIFDRNLKALALNLQSFSFAVDPLKIKQPRKVASKFALALGRDEKPLFKKLQSKNRFTWLARKLNKNAAERIESENFRIMKIVEPKRYYPLGHLAGQLIGYTNIDNVGIEGVEYSFENYLKGEPGWVISNVNAKGRRSHAFINPHKKPQPGCNVILTIDSRYQAIVEDELEKTVRRYDAKGATAIIMDPNKGEILAMAVSPFFNPNRPGEYEPQKRRNKAIVNVFEPGSIFKIVVLSAVLEEGIVSSQELIFCENGSIKIAGEVIHDWKKFGWLTFKEVIENSSNIGVIKVAQDLGKRLLYKYIRLFGFGSKTGVELPGEAKGIVHHPSEWSELSLPTIAIGQGIAVTSLQLATAYSAIANGGILLKPHILKAVSKDGEIIKRTHPEVIRRIVSKQTAQRVKNFLRGVVVRGIGKRAAIEGFHVAGKTGTAQKAGESGYIPGKFVSSFVGFLPVDNPKLLCLVVVDEPKRSWWGGEVAATTFRNIVVPILNLERGAR